MTITVACEEWPLYHETTEAALAAMPEFDASARRGYLIHRGYHMDLDPPIGTANVFVGRFDPNAFVFGPVSEVDEADRDLAGRALIAALSDNWIDDIFEMELAERSRGLDLGPDSVAICLPGALLVEAGHWQIWRGDVETLQREMDRQARIFLAPGLSAHRKIKVLATCFGYIQTMIRQNSSLDRKDSRNSLKMPSIDIRNG